MLRCERLEAREVMSSAVLQNGLLAVTLDNGAAHTASIDASGTNIVVTVDGSAIGTFAAANVSQLVVNGGDRRDVIQNNTAVTGTLLGNAGDDTLFGGTGLNVVSGGAGRDTTYTLLGTNTVLTQGGGKDRVFANAIATVSADKSDSVVRFFAAGRTPGSGFVGQDADGVLYVAPTNNGSSTFISQTGKAADALTVRTDLGDGKGVQTLSFTGVKGVAFFGGTGKDVYVNDSTVVDAAYGSGGDDLLVGGRGEFTLLKGSGGNDLLVGRARQNDVSGNSGADVILLVNEDSRNDVLRSDASDVLFGKRADTLGISG
jgi:Ca2+-binding RTX toxin-like protein